MSVDEEECEAIAKACEESGVIVAVCHVLRYFPPCVKIKGKIFCEVSKVTLYTDAVGIAEIIDSGAIGEVVTINHIENVHYWHFAHR